MIQPASLESLTDEFLTACRRGESPNIEEYARNNPRWSKEIRETFPTVRLMETFKTKKRLSVNRGQFESHSGIIHGAGGLLHLNDYRIVREIGRGGMGVVYEAVQESLQRSVALKALKMPCASAGKEVERFEREAKAAASLHHTNIVPVFDVGQQDDVRYYVMQLIEGVSLDEVIHWLRSSSEDSDAESDESSIGDIARALLVGRFVQPLKTASEAGAFWQSIARIGADLADALAYAHERGTLHRDIKPGNLILDHQGRVWITDFGLAHQVDNERLTVKGDAVGTLRYMASEQFDGRCSGHSDVYSLGATLYELATLRPAFSGKSKGQLIERILRDAPLPPRKIRSDVPRDLETIIVKAMAREPSDRYESAKAMGDDLLRFLEDRPILARRANPLERFWRWGRRNPAVAASTAAAAALLLIAVVTVATGFWQVSSALTAMAVQRQLAQNEAYRAETNLARVREERGRAEANLGLSLEALDMVFARLGAGRAYHEVEGDYGEAPFDTRYHPLATVEDVSLLMKMLEFYDRFAEQNQQNAPLTREAAKAYHRVADIQRRLGNFQEAQEAYCKSLALHERLLKDEPIESRKWTQFAILKNDLGSCIEMMGQPADAQQCHLDALGLLRKQLALAPDSPAIEYELVRTHNFLGNALWGRGRSRSSGDVSKSRRPTLHFMVAAQKSLHTAMQMLEKLLKDDPLNPEYRLMMARTCRDLATMMSNQGRFWQAKTLDEQATDLLRCLAEQWPTSPIYKYELMRTLSKWSRLSFYDGSERTVKSERRVRQALHLAEELAASHPDVPEYGARLAYTQFKMAWMLKRQNRLEEAAEQYRLSIANQRKQIQQYPGAPLYEFYLATQTKGYVDLLLTMNKYEEARDVLCESLIRSRDLPDRLQTPSTRMHAKMVVRDLKRDLAKSYRALGENEKAAQLE